MSQLRYSPKEFVELIKAQAKFKKIGKIEEAMLYGMVLGRLAPKNRTDGKITHSQAEKLAAVYNRHIQQAKVK